MQRVIGISTTPKSGNDAERFGMLGASAEEALEHLPGDAPQVAMMNLKFETVRSYVKKIYEKFQAHSRTEAVSQWKGG